LDKVFFLLLVAADVDRELLLQLLLRLCVEGAGAACGGGTGVST